MLDKRRNRDFWTWKPKKWVATFKEDLEDKGKKFFTDFVWDFEVGKKAMNGNIQRQHYFQPPTAGYKIPTHMLYKIVPQDVNLQEIKQMSNKLLEIMNSTAGRKLYEAQFDDSQSTKVKASVHSPSGDYWKTSTAMVSKQPVIKEHTSLDCVFTCDTIWKIVTDIFGIPSDDLEKWDSEVKEFTFGRSIKEGKNDSELLIDYESLMDLE
jgi:hypothetical protein